MTRGEIQVRCTLAITLDADRIVAADVRIIKCTNKQGQEAVGMAKADQTAEGSLRVPCGRIDQQPRGLVRAVRIRIDALLQRGRGVSACERQTAYKQVGQRVESDEPRFRTIQTMGPRCRPLALQQDVCPRLHRRFLLPASEVLLVELDEDTFPEEFDRGIRRVPTPFSREVGGDQGCICGQPTEAGEGPDFPHAVDLADRLQWSSERLGHRFASADMPRVDNEIGLAVISPRSLQLLEECSPLAVLEIQSNGSRADCLARV